MEVLNNSLSNFIAGYNSIYGYGYGKGYGDGSGYGNGSGYGYGNGSGNGYGNGSGNGYGNGSGYGYGYGYGNGYGDGYGDGNGSGDGSGDGYGSGYGLVSYNSHPVYYIDGVPTILERCRNNVAKGYIVNKDLTTETCYIVKSGSTFAHGKTFNDAQKALSDKLFAQMNVSEKIEAFLNEFDLNCEYPARSFYEWHHKLTGSCEFGRYTFVKNHSIDLDRGYYTVKEFIDLTENDYGGDIIRQLKERIYHEST